MGFQSNFLSDCRIVFNLKETLLEKEGKMKVQEGPEEPKGKNTFLTSFIYVKNVLVKRLDLRLLRRILRWDLKESSLFSCATTYDITMLSTPQNYQQVMFGLKNDLEGTLNVLRRER